MRRSALARPLPRPAASPGHPERPGRATRPRRAAVRPRGPAGSPRGCDPPPPAHRPRPPGAALTAAIPGPLRRPPPAASAPARRSSPSPLLGPSPRPPVPPKRVPAPGPCPMRGCGRAGWAARPATRTGKRTAKGGSLGEGDGRREEEGEGGSAEERRREGPGGSREGRQLRGASRSRDGGRRGGGPPPRGALREIPGLPEGQCGLRAGAGGGLLPAVPVRRILMLEPFLRVPGFDISRQRSGSRGSSAAAAPRPPRRPRARAEACTARSGPEPGPAVRPLEPARCRGRRRRKRAGNEAEGRSGKESAAAAGPCAPRERRAALPAGSGCPRGGAAEHDGALGGPRPPLGIAVRR